MERVVRIEPDRGVYDAPRAAALAGIPVTTLHRWARTGLYRPSISPDPRVRLWSWSDLLALRAIDWFRRTEEPSGPPRVSIQKIRQALAELDREGISQEALHQVVAESSSGEIFIKLGNGIVHAAPGRQAALPNILPLVSPYGGGPDLLEPRPQLRIIPGKLHGEPHLLGTRIPSATVHALHESGYSLDDIRAMYPEASCEAICDAIDLERSLRRRAA